MSENPRSEILRVDLQLVVELSEDESDRLSLVGIHTVGDIDLPTLLAIPGLPTHRANDIYDAVNLFVERMLRT